MVRMSANSAKAKSSVYLTFRTMSSQSIGWVIAAKTGLELAKKVEDAVRHDVEDIVFQAVWREIPNKVLRSYGLMA